MKMIRRRLRTAACAAVCLVLSVAAASPAPATSRELSFAERVAAQTAIERARYAHRVGTDLPFERAVPPQTIERIVLETLRESAALEAFWQAPITPGELDRETERIFRATRMPARLEELVAAVGGDPLLVREMIARPALSGRLLRQRFASQPVTFGVESFDAWWARIAPTLDTGRVETVGSAAPLPEMGLAGRPGLAGRTGVAGVAERSGAVGGPGPAGLAADAGAAGDSGIRAADSVSCPPGGQWDNGALASPPDARSYPTGVWTGSLFLVWGGEYSFGGTITRFNTGGRYDPATDTWRPMSTVNAPEARSRHTAVWTGTRMIVWGGLGGQTLQGSYLNTGASYDPVADAWTAISLAGAPEARIQHTAVWAVAPGQSPVMVVWGGLRPVNGITNTGGRYNPATDTWQATTMTNAPLARAQHSAVWANLLGEPQMIVFGGIVPGLTNSGGRYDPFADTWTDVTTTGAPAVRSQHQAVWSGTEMLVWGGASVTQQPVAGGGRYDPTTDSWTAMSTVGGPAKAYGYSAHWTGTKLLVWGGFDGGSDTSTGAAYDAATDSWVALADTDAPDARSRHASVWTGTEMMVWGGTGLSPLGAPNTPLASGGRYTPGTNSWNPVPFWTEAAYEGAPLGREGHSTVWTGTELIVWGGQNVSGALATGGRYDPVLDLWSATTATSAPSARSHHTAVWSGTQMIVWGGLDRFANPLASGSRYDPEADSWSDVIDVGAPVARYRHTAVWTGQAMIVWGGTDDSGDFSTGGLYDPVNDFWIDTANAGAPLGRTGHTAVMTGSGMVVWGGQSFDGSFLQSGAVYVPGANIWSGTTSTGAPTARAGHAAVWSGTRMLVWGGEGPASTAGGGSYNPANNTWSALAGAGAPSPLSDQAAVWTGASLLVWGGTDANGNVSAQGSLYRTGTDSWGAATATNAPVAREDHTGVWADGQLFVWGGKGPGYFGDGGRYVPTDLDGDGDSVCAGDCDDLDPTVGPSHPELCDHRDNNCDGTVDEGNPESGQACTTSNPGLCAAGHTQCNNGTLSCLANVTPVGADADGDGVDNACDNCPSLASANLSDLDGDGTGDPCDFTLFAPGDNTHYTGKAPPASFSWGAGGWQQFLVELSTTQTPFNPTLFKKWVTTTNYKFASKYWTKIRKAALANGGVIYWRVSGRMTGATTSTPSDQVYTITWSP